MRLPLSLRIMVVVAGLFAWSTTLTGAQEVVRELFAGDSVRIDGELVGRVLNIDGPNMTVVSRLAPRCRAGQMHGDAPICDPAPLIRRQMLVQSVQIERRMQKGNPNVRTVIGGLLGFTTFGAAGYFIGPALGFEKVNSCLSGNQGPQCDDPAFRERLEADQLHSDRRRGVLFFGVIGGSFVAVMARKLSTGWVRVEPSVPVGSDEPWTLSLRVPTHR